VGFLQALRDRLTARRELHREHLLDRFDCGKEDLNRFLIRQAWNNQQAHMEQRP